RHPRGDLPGGRPVLLAVSAPGGPDRAAPDPRPAQPGLPAGPDGGCPGGRRRARPHPARPAFDRRVRGHPGTPGAAHGVPRRASADAAGPVHPLWRCRGGRGPPGRRPFSGGGSRLTRPTRAPEPALPLRAVVRALPRVVYEALTARAALSVWLAEHADVEWPGKYEFWGRFTPDGAEPHQRLLYADERTVRFAWTVDGVESTVQ